jgi:fermentation-respiration switch protein FrsA (DUF1100 family)
MPNPFSLSALKRKLLFPGSLTRYSLDELRRLSPGESIVVLTTRSGARSDLLVATSGTTVSSGLPRGEDPWHLLFFYGNGMSLAVCEEMVAFFGQLGLRVCIAEYEGYGMSSGQASEAGCYASAEAAYAYLTRTLLVKPRRLLVGGWSLGAAVAIDLARRQSVAGLVTLSPFTTLIEEASIVLPWLPRVVIGCLVQDRFDNRSKIGQIRCPILIAHGTHDELVPFAMAQRLADAARLSRSVTLLPLRRCHHNDLFACGGDDLQQGIATLLMQAQQETTP